MRNREYLQMLSYLSGKNTNVSLIFPYLFKQQLSERGVNIDDYFY